MKHIVQFSAQELVLLEEILNRSVKHTFGLWTGTRFAYIFEEQEMEEMATTIYQEQTKSFNKWLDMLQAQEAKKTYTGRHELTQEMRTQWKYTGQVEELYDRIASPIGRSHRCSEEEAKEMMEYYDKLEYLDTLEDVESLEPLEILEKLEGQELLEGWNIWKLKKK